MKNRYKKFVLEAGNGIYFDVLNGANGELIIRALSINRSKVYSTNYVNPPIPEGYKHICGEWNNGFVIERCFDGSQFVWIPVGSLDYNGTLDGDSFDEKFGRRDYKNNNNFFDNGYNEIFTYELEMQLESVKKYGGFYISRYNISKSSDGKPQSVRGAMPWVIEKGDEAKKIASTIENNEAVKSHLTFGAEYDSILEWFIKTKVKTIAEIVNDSTKWGNYYNSENNYSGKVVKTGSKEEWCVNNIYDFAGNVDEWTQEKWNSFYIFRGGSASYKNLYPVAAREYMRFRTNYFFTGFRAALYIK